jgi:DNA-directed RNA polymerase specialized sigma24 family protein
MRFFVRLATAPYELDTPEQVLKLLVTLARNQVINEALHQQAAKRDCRRMHGAGAQEWEALAGGSSPSAHLVADELLEKARQVLSTQEARLLELRKDGWEWADLARRLGGTPEGLRKQLARAVARVKSVLGFVEVVNA